jgi:hypothetical protein
MEVLGTTPTAAVLTIGADKRTNRLRVSADVHHDLALRLFNVRMLNCIRISGPILGNSVHGRRQA